MPVHIPGCTRYGASGECLQIGPGPGGSPAVPTGGLTGFVPDPRSRLDLIPVNLLQNQAFAGSLSAQAELRRRGITPAAQSTAVVRSSTGFATTDPALRPITSSGGTVPTNANAFSAPIARFGFGDVIRGIGGFLGDVFLGGGDPGSPTFAPGICVPPFVRQADGTCRFDLDPGAGTGFPGGPQEGLPASAVAATSTTGAAAGLASPTPTSVTVHKCPRFADGKVGILWMNALSGQLVCLPRATNGRGFGLIRKNHPRRKAFITAAAISNLKKRAGTERKAKDFAKLAGFTCKKR